MNTKVKNDNFIVIQGYMINDLNLKGNELLIYAIINGFSQEEGQVYSGSLQYLAEWTNSTKQGIIKNLKSLIDKGIIGKNEKFINGVKFCEYYTTKFNGGIKQSLMGGIKQSLPNNIDIYNINNNIDIKKERKNKTTYDEIINSKINNQDVKDLLYEFIKMRKLKKKPLTDRALTIQINKLFKLSSKEEEQKQIIENSIVKCWDEFYPLKKEANNEITRTSIARDGSEYAEYD